MFVNLEAVRLVDARQLAALRWGLEDKTIADLYRSVVDAGGKFWVCSHCAEVAGVAQDNLREGATIATFDQVTEAMLAADKVIDY